MNPKEFKAIVDALYFVADDLSDIHIEYNGMDILCNPINYDVWDDYDDFLECERLLELINYDTGKPISDELFIIQIVRQNVKYDCDEEYTYSEPMVVKRIVRTITVEDYEEVVFE